MANNKDIVDLRIEAENLASANIIKAAEDVEGLGRKAEKAQVDVEKLEVTRDSLDSFNQASVRIEGLQNDVVDATIQFKKLKAELKDTESATDDQTAAVVKQQLTVKKLNAELRSAETEHRKIDAALRTVGVNTKNYTVEQERLISALTSARVKSDALNDTYDTQIAKIRERINQQKKVVDATKVETSAQAALTSQIDKQNATRRVAVDAAVAEAIAARELTKVIDRYEAELKRLNAEKAEGNVTTGDYIRAEAKLRRQLQLTASQVSTSRRAIEADADSKTKASRATDLLTTTTRRLAQAYTVLIAVQTAAQAVIGNVESYGKLESSIVGIERTSGLAADKVAEMADEIIKLSTDITPTAIEDLFKFGEVAGQLGVSSTADILNLVAAADQLGTSTNIAGDEAATLLTRILQTTGEGVPKIQNIASSVVTLGNNFAATESEIVHFTRNIVTATREIDLSSSASAALGATLAVTGLQAESSRTAIGRLARTIRRAATEGGESLEALANITSLTGEEIRDALLGGESEKIILGFVEGLAKVQGQGEVTLDTLRRFGIDGEEASQVFSSLASRVDTLRESIDLSNDSYATGTAQVIEASKAYATQEASIGRLRNTFEALRIKLGETFSDETDESVRKFKEGINGAEQELLDLFEILPDVISGLEELVVSVDNLTSSLGIGLGDALDGIVESFSVFFNLLNVGFNTLAGGLQQLVLGTAEAYSSINEILGNEVDQTFINSLKDSISNTRSVIFRDVDDITASIDRLSGTTSRQYQDLIDITEKYGDSIGRLTEGQQTQLKVLLEQNGYLEENNGAYITLTAAIVKANRQREIEERLTAKNIELAKASKAAADTETAAKTATAEASERKNSATNQELMLADTLSVNLIALNTRYREGAIDAGVLIAKTILLNAEYENQIIKAHEVRIAREAEITSTQEVIAGIATLITQYRDGAISIDEYTQGQQELEFQLNRANSALLITGQTAGFVTREQLKLQVEIIKSADEVQKLESSLSLQNLTLKEISDTTAKLRVEEEKLNGLREEETRINDIANASYFQIANQRDIALKQMTLLQSQFESGSITAGEYQVRQFELKETITQLNAVLGDTPSAINDTTVAQNKAAVATEELTNIVKKGTSFTNLYGQAYNYLNREFDFTSNNVVELSQRLEDLQSKINTNNNVTSSWWRELANVNTEGFQREQAMIRETLALRKYTVAVESGNLSLNQLNNISRSASVNIRNLGDNQLEPLRRAIAEAKREFQDLNESIDDALNDTLDRLDEVRGNQEEIVKRRYEQERRQYEELLSLAQQSGDVAAISRAQTVLRQLQQAQKLEFKQQFTNEPVNNNNASNQTYTVNLQLPDGGFTTVNVVDQDSVNSLLSTFESFGEVSVSGGN